MNGPSPPAAAHRPEGGGRVPSSAAIGRALRVGLFALAGILFLTAAWVPPLCPMRLLLHVPCPSCGLTRAARCLLHGDLAGATAMHPLWWLVFPYLAALLGVEAATYVRTGGASRLTGPLVRLGWLVLAAMIAVWIARGFGALGGPAPIG